MGQTLDETAKSKAVAEIEHYGEKLILPTGMTIKQSIELLRRRAKYEETEVEIHEKFDVFPFDGAYALSQVIQSRFGWQQGVATRHMFGEHKPEIYKIEVSPTDKVDVPWGLFSLPHIDGTLHTSVTKTDAGRFQFVLTATIKRKDEGVIRELFDELRAYLRVNSIYRGKAIKIRFRDDDGDAVAMPEPTFMRLDNVRPENLLLNTDLAASVQANLFTPITRVDDCIANGIKVKRGVLLGGRFGTGKTLAAMVAARLAQDAGITYVYVPRAAELADGIAFAKQYQSPACVVFCEDIDRTVQGERTVEIDDVLNILDGIDTKNENIITVLTTNRLDNVNQAMLRPGRLDAIINVVEPDAECAERLVRFYGGEAIAPEEDLTEVGESLAGQIPAVIEEAVKRAKLFELSLIDKGAAVTGLSAEALRNSAMTMTAQIELLREKADDEPDKLETAFTRLVEGVVRDEGTQRMRGQVGEIHERVTT